MLVNEINQGETVNTVYIKNVIRTVVPAIAGAVIACLTKWKSHIPATDLAIVTPIATSVYYSVFRALEQKFKWASVFLGALPAKDKPVA